MLIIPTLLHVCYCSAECSVLLLLLFSFLQSRMEPSEQSGLEPGSQDVNPVFLQQLRELDIPEEAAKQVGQHTEGGHLVSAWGTHPTSRYDSMMIMLGVFLWYSQGCTETKKMTQKTGQSLCAPSSPGWLPSTTRLCECKPFWSSVS